MTPSTTERRSLSSVVERCARDMVVRWADGARPLAEEYFDRHADLWQHPDAALELLAEELALRDEYGLPATASELETRFPRWQPQVQALFNCHRVLSPELAPPAFPNPGDWLGDFHLQRELGHGAHGRVYLATQPLLAGRAVVLKVSPDSGGEHLSLARLQHTHIVPLYSVHDFPDRRLRALCLPYFGGATLAQLQTQLAERESPPTGRDLLAELWANQRHDRPVGGPAWGFLDRVSLAEAVGWIGAGLADALQYAHDRGLLHLDIKPSNVLIAGDGVPMLLDFHLARAPLAAGETAPPWLGGTPGHMAPEHLAALQAVREGQPLPLAVDGRADVFALGTLLAGFLHETRADVSLGLADILARCLAPNAADRYATAGALAADLRRHLSDLPLKGVGNRSLTERWTKWRRRQPYAFPLVLTLAACLVGALGLGLHANRLTERATAALRDGQAHANAGRYAEAVEAYRGGETLIEPVPFTPELRTQLRDARQSAERVLAANDLHTFAERVRLFAATEALPPDHQRALERRCRDVWAQRTEFVAKLSGQPTADRETRWRTDLLDVTLLVVRLDQPDAKALETLAEAERLVGSARVIELERARLLRQLGRTAEADAALQRAETHPRRGIGDHLTAGRAHLGVGDVSRAASEFDAALALDPPSLWANHYRGVCHLRQKQPTEAVAAFAACVALAPRAAWCVSNRGLAYLEAGRLDAARADFDRALLLDPTYAPALAGRTAVDQKRGKARE